MAETASNMLPLGTKAPDFTLLDVVSGRKLSLQELKSNHATVVMFICNHCPYVIHIQAELVKLAREFIEKGVSFIAISSNDIEQYPADSPDKMKVIAKRWAFPFPYLYDETQEVARAYQAACTPDFYIFDSKLSCTYRGRFDGSTPGNDIQVTGDDLREALESILANRRLMLAQIPSLGCNIKWKNS
ncbi:MAG: thiol-disulfide isomerase and thioredoxin [Gammaproteobacteria bacterium]|jgi:peroxiredoxin|nr:thiol-disulfide isomerase and thioredoxin [Gammaproteobacteria bacterium]